MPGYHGFDGDGGEYGDGDNGDGGGDDNGDSDDDGGDDDKDFDDDGGGDNVGCGEGGKYGGGSSLLLTITMWLAQC